MGNRSVEAQKKILLLLLESEMGINAVQKQTSSDKKFAENVLKNLRKGKLIQQTKDEKHKQKKIQSLTLLGRELAQVLTLVNENKEMNKGLDEKIKSFLDIDFVNLKNKQGILLAKGWTSEETKHYIPYVVDSNRLQYYVQRCINEFVMYRYAEINQKYELNNIGRDIVYNVVSSIMNEYVQSVLMYFKGMKSYVLPLLNLRYEVKKQIERYNNRFIAAEISKLEGLIDRQFETRLVESNAKEQLIAVMKELKKSESGSQILSEIGETLKRSAKELKIDESSLMDLVITELSCEIKQLGEKEDQ